MYKKCRAFLTRQERYCRTDFGFPRSFGALLAHSACNLRDFCHALVQCQPLLGFMF
jgi:hypothetical protein